MQIGQVVIPENNNPAICSESTCQVSSSQSDDDCMEEMPEADSLRTFYDGAERTTQFFSVTNVKIVTDDSDSFLGDKARMARKCGLNWLFELLCLSGAVMCSSAAHLVAAFDAVFLLAGLA